MEYWEQEYNYAIRETRKHAARERDNTVKLINALISAGVLKEDLLGQLEKDLGDDCNNSVLKPILASMGLYFNKSNFVAIKANRLRLEGVPKEKIAQIMYERFSSHCSKQLIRNVCARLGYTDGRFANKRGAKVRR